MYKKTSFNKFELRLVFISQKRHPCKQRSFLEDKYANIFFEIPPELSSWIDSDKFKEKLDQIREEISKDYQNSELFIVSYPEEEDSLSLRVLCNSEKKDFVKLFMGKAIEGEKILTTRDLK